MNLSAALLVAAVGLLVGAVPLLLYILTTLRTANLHAIWDEAVRGGKWARAYVVIVGLAFALALAAQVLILFGSKT